MRWRTSRRLLYTTCPQEQQRWYAIKIFERDDKVLEKLNIDPTDTMAHIEEDIKAAEKELDDDAESIITNERYVYIASLIKSCYKKKNAGKLSTSDKIDKVVTNRWLGLPIFAAYHVPCLLYFNGNRRYRRYGLGKRRTCSATAGICSASARADMKTQRTNIADAMNAVEALSD